MPNERKEGISAPWTVWLFLAAIVLVGAALRLYHFGDWLHFEVDQSRDARVIERAIEEGIGSLPLLGPRAGGTFLRLGPGFYDLQYASALLFGMTPPGIALGIALLSIASISIFFLFVRRIFADRLALGLTALFAVSEFLVVYGRFAWNPNPLPFFLLAGFLALLRATDGRERRPGRWFVASAALIGFATHLHFLAFVSMPVIVGLFLIVIRPRFSWRAWLGAVLVLGALYLPVVLNDIATGGANMEEFLQAVTGKANKEHHTIVEQAYQSAANQAVTGWTMLSGFEWTELPRVKSVGPIWVDIKCDGGCRERLVSGSIASALWLSGVLMLLWEVVRYWRVRSETTDETVSENPLRRNTLLLALMWFAVCSALFVPLSYDFSPRFFLLIAPIPFILLGLTLEGVWRLFGWNRTVGAAVLSALAVLAISNLWFLSERFGQTDRAMTEAVSVPSDRILKEKTRVTLEQQRAVVRWMRSYQERNGWPIYFFSEPEYRRAMRYLVEAAGISRVDVQRFYNGPVYAHGNYFVIFRSRSDLEDALSDFRGKFDVAERVPFGTLTGFVLTPKAGAVTDTEQVFADPSQQQVSPSAAPERFTWKEWWRMHTDTPENDSDPSESE